MSDFSDRLYTFLYQALRAGGTDLTIPAMDKLRNASTELSKLFSKEMREVAGEVCDEVQKEVDKGFDRVIKDVSKLEAKLETVQEDIHEELTIAYNGPDKDE